MVFSAKLNHNNFGVIARFGGHCTDYMCSFLIFVPCKLKIYSQEMVVTEQDIMSKVSYNPAMEH